MRILSDAAPYAFELEPLEVNLGVLRPDENTHFEFFIVNRDARPLKLVNIDGSCDCVAFTWERGDIAPGARRKISTEVRAENRGSKLLSVYVQANDIAATTREIGIRYVVEPELTFDPPRVDFGKRVVGSPARVDVAVRYQLPNDCEPLVLAPVIVPPLPVTVRVLAPVITLLAGGLQDVHATLELELDASRPVAPFRAELVLESTRHKQARLPLTGTVHEGAYLEPAELHLGVAAIGTPRRATARLRFARDGLEIQTIDTLPASLTAVWSPEPGGRSCRIEVTLIGTEAGDIDGEVHVRTSASAEPLLLRVRAKVR